MSPGIQNALIGVIGTLAGTILGWLLNNFSKRGKLNIYVSSWEETPQHHSQYGELVPCHKNEQFDHYSYKLLLDIYNNSSETKIMRKIQVVYSKGRKILFYSIPNDESSTKTSCSSFHIYYKTEPINIPPKSVIQLKLCDGMCKEDSLDNLWESNIVYLKYTNEKNKDKTVLILKDRNFESLFLDEEDTQNGQT